MLAVKHKRNEFERQALVHLDALYGAAYRLTRNPRDAEDLVQDALLRAYKFWDSFQQDSNCKAWLLRIVTNTFINEYQRRKRSREVLDAASAEQDATDGVLVQASASDKQSPDQALLAAALKSFAVAEGYVKSAGKTETKSDAPIDLEKYRAARAREGSGT